VAIYVVLEEVKNSLTITGAFSKDSSVEELRRRMNAGTVLVPPGLDVESLASCVVFQALGMVRINTQLCGSIENLVQEDEVFVVHGNGCDMSVRVIEKHPIWMD
jgi:hypothetical protein